MILDRRRRTWLIVGISGAVVLTVSIVLAIIFLIAPLREGIVADKWRLHVLNRRIDHYIKEGNPIEKSDDLIEALLDGEDDLAEKLSPKSAKWGYHFWYDVGEQKIVLARYNELTNPLNQVATALTDGAQQNFESDSPRSMLDGYYFLDMDGTEDNKLGSFFGTLRTMKSAQEYKEALDSLVFSAFEADKMLGEQVASVMCETVIISTNGIFTNADDASAITRVYIPENISGGEEILIGIPHHVRGSVELSAVNIGCIRIPDAFKVGEFCFEDFGEGLTLSVNAESAQALGEIVSVDSARGWISISTGERFRIENDVLKDQDNAVVQIEKDGAQERLLLPYRRPVTDFAIGSEAALSKGEGAVYIDPKAITEEKPNGTMYVAYSLPSFILNAQNFNESASSLDVIWEEVKDDRGLISVDPNTGRVTLDLIPNVGGKANYTAVVKATARAGGYSETIELYVVRPTAITLNFGAKVVELKEGATQEISFDYTKADNMKTFSIEKITYNKGGMVACDISETYTSNVVNDTDFRISEAGVVEILKPPGVLGLKRSVFVRVGCFRAMCEISVTDVSDNPIDVRLKNGNYIYKVGNANPVRLGHLFKVSDGYTVGADEIMVDVQTITGKSILDETEFGARITMPHEQIISAENWENAELQFTGTGLCTVEIRTSKTASVKITLEIVNGTNVFEWVTGNASGNLVLQSDVVTSAKSYMLNLGEYTLYGNGFIIDAKAVTKPHPVDDPSTPENENSMNEDVIQISGGKLDGVVLIGNAFEEIHNSSDKKNPYWVHGVNTYKKGTIENSYIFGFRSPVRVESGSLTMNNTVLEGGSLSNMFIKNATSLKFHNVTTIQAEYAPGVIGCGLLFTNYKGSSVLTVTGEFNQYNYATKKQLTKIGGEEYGLLISNKLSRMTQFKHGSYYHTGMLILGQGHKNGGTVVYDSMADVQHNLGALGYTSGTDTSEIIVYVKATLVALDNTKCGGCTPKLVPDDLTGDGKYDHLDFIFHLTHSIPSAG